MDYSKFTPLMSFAVLVKAAQKASFSCTPVPDHENVAWVLFVCGEREQFHHSKRPMSFDFAVGRPLSTQEKVPETAEVRAASRTIGNAANDLLLSREPRRWRRPRH